MKKLYRSTVDRKVCGVCGEWQNILTLILHWYDWEWCLQLVSVLVR